MTNLALWNGAQWVSRSAVPQAGYSAPSPPTDLVVVGALQRITATWRPPLTTGGSPVHAFRARLTGGPQPEDLLLAGTSREVTFAGLADSSPYTVTVWAISAIGSSTGTSDSAETSSAGAAFLPLAFDYDGLTGPNGALQEITTQRTVQPYAVMGPHPTQHVRRFEGKRIIFAGTNPLPYVSADSSINGVAGDREIVDCDLQVDLRGTGYAKDADGTRLSAGSKLALTRVLFRPSFEHLTDFGGSSPSNSVHGDFFRCRWQIETDAWFDVSGVVDQSYIERVGAPRYEHKPPLDPATGLGAGGVESPSPGVTIGRYYTTDECAPISQEANVWQPGRTYAKGESFFRGLPSPVSLTACQIMQGGSLGTVDPAQFYPAVNAITLFDSAGRPSVRVVKRGTAPGQPWVKLTDTTLTVHTDPDEPALETFPGITSASSVVAALATSAYVSGTDQTGLSGGGAPAAGACVRLPAGYLQCMWENLDARDTSQPFRDGTCLVALAGRQVHTDGGQWVDAQTPPLTIRRSKMDVRGNAALIPTTRYGRRKPVSHVLIEDSAVRNGRPSDGLFAVYVDARTQDPYTKHAAYFNLTVSLGAITRNPATGSWSMIEPDGFKVGTRDGWNLCRQRMWFFTFRRVWWMDHRDGSVPTVGTLLKAGPTPYDLPLMLPTVAKRKEMLAAQFPGLSPSDIDLMESMDPDNQFPWEQLSLSDFDLAVLEERYANGVAPSAPPGGRNRTIFPASCDARTAIVWEDCKDERGAPIDAMFPSRSGAAGWGVRNPIFDATGFYTGI